MLQKVTAQVVLPPLAEGMPLLEQAAAALALHQLHQLAAGFEAAEQQHLYLQRGTPHIHGAIDQEGALGHQQHRSAVKAWLQHQIQQALQTTLHPLAHAEIQVLAAFHVQPAEHGPPECGVHRADPADRALPVVRHQLPLFFHEAGGKHAADGKAVALEIEADLQEMAHDRKAPLQQQLHHHGHVVAQKHLPVVGFLSEPGMGKSGNRADGCAVDGNQGALKKFLSPKGHAGVLGEERLQAESGHGVWAG